MKKLLYSLLTLAAALTVASCQQELEGGSVYDDGTTVDATFAVNLGPQTKAFADGTTVDKLYAGIYEIGTNNAYTWVADNADAPVAINTGGASVTFNGKITLGKSYKVVFWAQKDGAPYTIDWAKSATSGPNVTATATGAANDESRDAFYGAYETGAVTGNIDLTSSPVTLKRPFAQVNVLVPTANFVDATAAVTSSMTVAQAPTVLNLATKATSDPADWTFSSDAINETAFGSYSSTHKYVAMNYVLVPQDAAGASYNVTFSVTSAASTPQVAADKQVKNTPLKPNGRTNIVGNIFAEDFDITIPIVIGPTPGTDQVVTEVTVAVGQDQANAVALTPSATTSIEVGVNHAIEVEADKPAITVEPASFGTAEWNLTTGKLDVTPSVANGNAVITLVFPAVTKTDYSAATVQIYVKVGNGQNDTQTQQLGTPVLSEQGAATDETTIILDWEDVENAASYAVTYKVKDAQGEATTVTPAPTASEVTLSGLTAGTTYTITVQALPASTSAEYTASEVATIDLTTESPAADVKTLKSIAVTAPTKVEYTEGETLDLTGMVVKATYSHSNGDEDSEETLTEGFTTTPSAGATLATTNDKVTVSYTEGEVTKTAEFTITVNANNGDGTLTNPFNLAGVKAYIDESGSDDVYVKGKVSKINSAFDEEHGTGIFFISDDGTETAEDFEAYGIYFLGNKSWHEGNTQIAVGDDVILFGKVTKFNSTYETDNKKAYVYSLNGLQGLPAISLTENTVGDNSTKTITVEWSAVTGATAFTVECGTQNYSAGANETSHTFTMTDYGKYDVKVTATADGYEKSIVKGSVTLSDPNVTTTYTKVTTAPDDWSGTYIIVYESSETSGLVCVAGTDAYQNYSSAVINNGVISSNDLSDCEVLIASYSSGYSIKALGGANANKFIEGKGSSSNGTSFSDSASKETSFSISGDVVTITNNTNLFVYNSTSGSNGERWRFYKSGTAAGDVYKKPALYKKD